ncbi:penicillin-binding protein 2 [Patescibacteria group bacterium]|nr:penicillin-binding protein 2 [Patescibacteria group bacterium]
MVSKYSRSHSTLAKTPARNKIILIGIYLGLLTVLFRLFYWQIIKGSWLKSAALDQYERTLITQGQRGHIYTNDSHLLVGNTTRYHLVSYPYLLEKSPAEISQAILPLLLNDLEEYKESTDEAKKKELKTQLAVKIEQQLNKNDAKWVSLLPNLSEKTKIDLSALNIVGLDFEQNMIRLYPEASMAAHITGFVGKNEQGQPIGYFGIEGALNKELSGKKRKTTFSTDALGFSFLGLNSAKTSSTQGRDVTLTIQRDIQALVESALQKGLEQYGAKAGEVIIINPQTGEILALAAEPKFDQSTYNKFEQYLYKNPTLNNMFEPGSILKILTVASGIDSGVINPETKCTNCDKPRVIGKYTIRTWNDEYHPEINITNALAKSDNIAMIFVAEKMGSEIFKKYLEDFGIGEKLDIELSGDTDTPFPEKWGPVELATRSFGQGISTTSLQMIRAVATIANQGIMMQPQIIKKVQDPNEDEIIVYPKKVRQVISPETAQQVTEMMVNAAKSGEAQWTYSKTHSVAAKTGTSQIPAQKGGYQKDATIASFIGFAPPENPQFLMLVKLIEPQSSPWAAETAAPLWYKIAEKLFLSLNIPPDHQ